MYRKMIYIFFLVMLIPDTAFSHGGRLNSQGCHNDRKNGGYHCHRASSTPKPKVMPLKKSSNKIYKNCKEARAAGITPIRRGEPGYARHLDRDNCE